MASDVSKPDRTRTSFELGGAPQLPRLSAEEDLIVLSGFETCIRAGQECLQGNIESG